MALGPDSIRRNLDESAKLVEVRIDQLIRNSSSRRITIEARSLPQMSMDVWENVIRPKYLKAGWSVVEWVSDQREGDYIKLEG